MEELLNKYQNESEYINKKSSFKNTNVSTLIDSNTVKYDKIIASYKDEFLLEWKENNGLFTIPEEGYTVYISDSNHNIHSKSSSIKIEIPEGMTSVKVYYYSDGESNYDYLSLGPLDTESITSSNNVGTTKGNQKIWKSYTYTVPSTGTHFFKAVYSKDLSANSGEDRGAIAINFIPANCYKNNEKYLGIRNKIESTEITPYVMLTNEINYKKDSLLTTVIHNDIPAIQLLDGTNRYLSKCKWTIRNYDVENCVLIRPSLSINNTTGDSIVKIFIPKNSGNFSMNCFNKRYWSENATKELKIIISSTDYSAEYICNNWYNSDELILSASIIGDVPNKININNFEENKYLYIYSLDRSTYYVPDVSYTNWNVDQYITIPKRLIYSSVNRTLNSNEIIYNNVIIDPISNIKIYGKNSSYVVNSSFTTYVSATPSIHDLDEFVWTSSDENIATVEDGVIKTKNVGNTRITVSTVDGSLSDYFDLKVVKLAYSCDSIPENVSLKIGESYTYNANFVPSDSDAYISYIYSDSNVCTYTISEDKKSVIFIGVSSGTASISIYFDNKNRIETKKFNLIVIE